MGLDSIAATIANPFSQKVGNGGLRGSDFPKGFWIIEYINGQPNLDTQLQLVGNLMPFQPFEWGGKQRLVKQYYAGNPEPSVQVLGAQEGPVKIKGRLKDKRYTDPSAYGISYQFNLAINEMRKRGNLVRFGMHGMVGSWQGQSLSGDWIRWGFIENAEFKMNKLSWIDYDIEFLVMGETQPINNYFSAQEKTSPTAVNNKLLAAAANFQANYSAVPGTVPQSLAGLINGLIGDVATAINTVTGFIQNIINTAQSIENSANRAIGLIKNAQSTISKMTSQVDALTHGFNTLSSSGTPAGMATDAYNNISYLAEIMLAVLQLEQYLAQMRSQWTAIGITVPKSRYRVQAGDTLQNISVRFYGTANNASAIAEHNNLTSNTLVPGTVLEIPQV